MKIRGCLKTTPSQKSLWIVAMAIATFSFSSIALAKGTGDYLGEKLYRSVDPITSWDLYEETYQCHEKEPPSLTTVPITGTVTFSNFLGGKVELQRKSLTHGFIEQFSAGTVTRVNSDCSSHEVYLNAEEMCQHHKILKQNASDKYCYAAILDNRGEKPVITPYACKRMNRIAAEKICNSDIPENHPLSRSISPNFFLHHVRIEASKNYCCFDQSAPENSTRCRDMKECQKLLGKTPPPLPTP